MKSCTNTKRDYLERERRDLPPTLLFGYDAKTDNKSDFHCEELILKMKIYKKVSSRIFSTTNIKHNIFRKN